MSSHHQQQQQSVVDVLSEPVSLSGHIDAVADEIAELVSSHAFSFFDRIKSDASARDEGGDSSGVVTQLKHVL